MIHVSGQAENHGETKKQKPKIKGGGGVGEEKANS